MLTLIEALYAEVIMRETSCSKEKARRLAREKVDALIKNVPTNKEIEETNKGIEEMLKKRRENTADDPFEDS